MTMPHYDKQQVASSFSRFAPYYNDHAIVQQEIGLRLIERCRLLRHRPLTILDLGSGTGSLIQPLRKAFPKAHILGLDLAWGMMMQAKKKISFWQSLSSKYSHVQGDMEVLPFKDATFDLIFSNCTLQWANDLEQVFKEVKRCLKSDGSLFFSTLGPSTLKEIKHCWSQVDEKPHVHDFHDLQNYGNKLMHSGLKQPVVDQENITLEYQALDTLLKDLKFTGARNLNQNRHRGLTSPSKLKKLRALFEKHKTNHVFPCTYEVIYGHAVSMHPIPFNQNHTFPLKLKHANTHA